MKDDFEVIHKCNKEVEIAEMSKDIKSILELLKGNGKPGLVDKVESNTKARLIFYGFLIAVTSGFGIFIIKFIFER